MVPKTWNKTDLVDAVAEETKLTKKDVAAALDALVDVLTTALKNKDKVQLTGFGAFEVRMRAARKAKNLRTGEEITVPEAYVPAFKAGKGLKDAVK
jgi:DNA-binding protein HU-beta